MTPYEIINKCFISTSDGNLSNINTVHNVESFNDCVVDNVINVLHNCMYKFGVDLSNLPSWYKALEETEKLTKIKGEPN